MGCHCRALSPAPPATSTILLEFEPPGTNAMSARPDAPGAALPMMSTIAPSATTPNCIISPLLHPLLVLSAIRDIL